MTDQAHKAVIQALVDTMAEKDWRLRAHAALNEAYKTGWKDAMQAAYDCVTERENNRYISDALWDLPDPE
jgi:hypothetical protein